MENLQWSRREKGESGTVMKLRQGADVVAVDVITQEGVSGRMSVGGSEPWRLHVAPDDGASATTPDGRVYSAKPEEAGTKFTKAKAFSVDANGRALRGVNESANNWVVEDHDGIKLGQFTGFNSGVRDVELDLSDLPSDDLLSHEEAVFLAWLARIALENRLESRSTIIIATLVLLTILAVAVFLL